MNKMLLAGSTGIVLLSVAASPVWADDNASTFSLGYAQSHTNHAGTLRGVRLANNYEMSPDWELTTSFAWLNGSQRYSDESSNSCGRPTFAPLVTHSPADGIIKRVQVDPIMNDIFIYHAHTTPSWPFIPL